MYRISIVYIVIALEIRVIFKMQELSNKYVVVWCTYKRSAYVQCVYSNVRATVGMVQTYMCVAAAVCVQAAVSAVGTGARVGCMAVWPGVHAYAWPAPGRVCLPRYHMHTPVHPIVAVGSSPAHPRRSTPLRDRQ